jgi:hypothetical protein
LKRQKIGDEEEEYKGDKSFINGENHTRQEKRLVHGPRTVIFLLSNLER